MKLLFLASVLAVASYAQPISAGLKIGAPLTDALHLSSNATLAQVTADTNHYVVGPYIELKLPFRFSVEVDALYRSYDYRLAPPAPNNSIGSWEFPVMAKYKLLGGPVRPYIEGGPVFSHLSGVGSIVGLQHDSNYGITLGAGIEIHALVLKISPEIRWDGFAFRNFDTPGSLVQSNRNQVLFLVGIGF